MVGAIGVEPAQPQNHGTGDEVAPSIGLVSGSSHPDAAPPGGIRRREHASPQHADTLEPSPGRVTALLPVDGIGSETEEQHGGHDSRNSAGAVE